MGPGGGGDMVEGEQGVEDNKEGVVYGWDEWDVVAAGMEGTRAEVGSEVDNGCTEPCVEGRTVVDT